MNLDHMTVATLFVKLRLCTIDTYLDRTRPVQTIAVGGLKHYFFALPLDTSSSCGLN